MLLQLPLFDPPDDTPDALTLLRNGAVHEAVRHSPRPDRFDFSETVFPSD